VSSTLAFANNPYVFTGKYIVEHRNNCSVDVGSRAYVRAVKFDGKLEVEINFYGDEARIMSFLAESGSKRSEIPGGFIERKTTVRWPTSTMMVTKSVSKGEKYNRRIGIFQEESIVSLKGKVLTVVEKRDGREEERCVLVKN
jgi:hypothetical protein